MFGGASGAASQPPPCRSPWLPFHSDHHTHSPPCPRALQPPQSSGSAVCCVINGTLLGLRLNLNAHPPYALSPCAKLLLRRERDDPRAHVTHQHLTSHWVDIDIDYASLSIYICASSQSGKDVIASLMLVAINIFIYAQSTIVLQSKMDIHVPFTSIQVRI